MKCPTCGGELPAEVRFCPHCGAPVQALHYGNRPAADAPAETVKSAEASPEDSMAVAVSDALDGSPASAVLEKEAMAAAPLEADEAPAVSEKREYSKANRPYSRFHNASSTTDRKSVV